MSKVWSKKLPPDIPEEGDLIVYYGKGHMESIKQEADEANHFKAENDKFLLDLQSFVAGLADSVAPPMWGGTDTSKLQDKVLLCRVTSVKFFEGPGSVMRNGQFAQHPFAQIECKLDKGDGDGDKNTHIPFPCDVTKNGSRIVSSESSRSLDNSNSDPNAGDPQPDRTHLQSTRRTNITRILKRILLYVQDCGYAVAFDECVNRRDYPDYYR
jgi:hypothetical protein